MANAADVLGQGAAGAAAGWQVGGPIGAGVMGGVGLLGGLFGGRPQEDPLTRQNRVLQSNVAQQMYRFGTGVPGSDPGEQAAYAQERGQLGAAQRNAQQQVYGQYNPAQGANGLADMMQRMSNSQVGQQMNLSESHMLNALSQRRQALMDAANVGGRAAQTGPVWQPQSDLPQVLGQVAQMIARNKALGQGQGQNGGGQGGDVPYSGPTVPGGGTPAAPGVGAPLPPGGPNIPWPGVMGSLGMAPGTSGAVPDATTQGLPGGGPWAPGLPGGGPWAPGFMQQDAMTQGIGPGSQPANAAAGNMAPPAAANAPFGGNTPVNQQRQSLGLNFGLPPAGANWNNLAYSGLRY